MKSILFLSSAYPWKFSLGLNIAQEERAAGAVSAVRESDLGVVSLTPTSGIQITLKKKIQIEVFKKNSNEKFFVFRNKDKNKTAGNAETTHRRSSWVGDNRLWEATW